MGADPIENMRGRVQQCRRLAGSISDRQTSAILLQMARDIESDITRLEAKGARRKG